MPPTPNSLLSSVVYLYPSEKAAELNSGGATGFIFAVHSTQELHRHKYIVTNAHVVEDGAGALRINTLEGKADILPIDEKDWICHPAHDDLAVMPIKFGIDSYQYKSIGEKMLLHRPLVDELGIGAGHDVLMVGRFSKHQGKDINLPSMRFGNIAMMPKEPVVQEKRLFPDENGFMKPFKQESYIVEMRSIAGFSGSPVFVYNTGVYPTYGSQNSISYMHDPFMMLLGVDWGHFPIDDRTNTNISAVVPAWKLHDLLYSERLVNMRQEEDEKKDSELKESGAIMDTLHENF